MTKDIFLKKIAEPHTLVQLQAWLKSLPSTPERDNIVAQLKTGKKQDVTQEDVDMLTFPPPVQLTLPPIQLTNTPTQNTPTLVVSKVKEKDSVEPKTTIKPTSFKRGDVYMHPIFRHPCILLEYKDNHWICGLLTTDEACAELLEKCNSRMFSNSYFTKTMFTVKEPSGKFMSVFENATQVRSVLKKLRRILG